MKENLILKKILEIIIIITLITSIIGTLLYLYNYLTKQNNLTYFEISMVSLFLLGISILIYIFTYGNEEDDYNKYTVITNEEYKTLKKEIYNNKKTIKEQKILINKMKNIVK